MYFKRKLITTLKALPTILTFRRYYLCDECRKLHRFTGHDCLWEVFFSGEYIAAPIGSEQFNTM